MSTQAPEDLKEPRGGVTRPPSRFQRPSPAAFVVLVAVAGFLVHGYTQGAKLDPVSLAEGVPPIMSFLGEAFPPDFSRLGPIALSLLVTFEMALLGTIFGIILSVPIAVCAARNTTPHPVLYGIARGAISLFRTIPDLVWGLIFVIAVGLGPEAGVLAIAVDVMGFCGRFFAESIEEIDPGVMDSARCTGAGPLAVLLGTVLPSALPSFVAHSMFSLESATRSSVVLGLVGAGGIGIELSVAMGLLRYDEAFTIIIAIFVVVLGVERLSSEIRRRLRVDG